MIFNNKLLLAPYKIKRNLIYIILRLYGNYHEMHGLIINYKENPKCKDSIEKLTQLYKTAINLSNMLIKNSNLYVNGKEDLNPILNYTFGGKYE